MQTLLAVLGSYVAIGLVVGWVVRNVGPFSCRVDAGTYLTSVAIWPIHLLAWLYALRITGRI